MSVTSHMIQSNKINRAMQRSGRLFSSLKTISNTRNDSAPVLSMEIDHEKLESVELKWKKQRQRDQIKVVIAIVFLIVSAVLVCGSMSTWDYST